MAYRKQCDQCLLSLDEGMDAYLQIHGSISEQRCDEETGVEYRYLTPYRDTKLAFCDGTCLLAWIEEQKKQSPFVRRHVIPRRAIY